MPGFDSGSGITGILLRTEYLGERESWKWQAGSAAERLCMRIWWRGNVRLCCLIFDLKGN